MHIQDWQVLLMTINHLIILECTVLNQEVSEFTQNVGINIYCLASGDEAGFTEDWVQNHVARASQRQLEVHDVPQGAPRTQLQPQDEEESKYCYK